MILDQKKKSKIISKLFIGFFITSEMRMHLNLSASWKMAKEMHDENGQDLIEIHYEEHDYIGSSLENNKALYSDLKIEKERIEKQLQIYCPKLPLAGSRFYVFPQLFVC